METRSGSVSRKIVLGCSGDSRRGARRRTALVCASTAVFFFASIGMPGVTRGQQQWPNSSNPNPGVPQTDFPQDRRASNPDDVPMGPNDSLDTMDSMTRMLPLMPVDNSRLVNAEACQTWTAAAVNSPTVSVTRLLVPGNASHEFQKACNDFKDNKFKSAEDHVRKAVKIYSDYAPAWVLLGQILQADHNDQEAIDACRKAADADPSYAPPYICLAGFAARANDWDQAYSLSSHALSLDPATDPYAFLFAATADFHLRHLDQAEFYARSAEKLDKWNRIPEVHLLLADLCDAQGDKAGEAAELRKFLKTSPHNADWESAKAKLSKMEEPPPAKQQTGSPTANVQGRAN